MTAPTWATQSSDLLWVDVETTGLNPRVDFPLEIGFIVTDAEIAERARASWTIRLPVGAASELREGAPDAVRAMHDANGLWGELPEGTERTAIRQEIAAWLADNSPAQSDYEGAPLAGSSVHFDAAWCREWFPEVVAGRTHRLMDVSAVRLLFERTRPDVIASRPTPRKLHRVLPDIEDSIAELAHYMEALGLRHPSGSAA